MLGGKVHKWDELVLRVDGSGTCSPNSYIYGNIQSKHQIDYTLTARSLLLEGYSSNASIMTGTSAMRRYKLTAPGWTGTSSPIVVDNAGYTGSFSNYVKIKGVQLFQMPSGVFRAIFGDMEWWIEGSLYNTYPGYTATSGIADCPGSIPLLGFPPKLVGSAGEDAAILVPTYPCDIPPVIPANFTASASGTITGGWRYKEEGGSSYVAHPVYLNIITPPSTCSLTEAMPSMSAVDTWSGSIEVLASAVGVAATNTGTLEQRNGVIGLLPDMGRSVKRWNDDYHALILRMAVPESYHLSTCSCTVDETVTTTSVHTTQTPARSQYLQEATAAISAIDDLLNDRPCAPYIASAFKSVRVGCDYNAVARGSSYPYLDTTSPTGGASNLPHADTDIAWFNFIANPHWSYGVFFPQDSATGAGAWQLNGTDIRPTDYWLPVRSQWNKNALLPSTGTKTRNDIFSEPLDHNGLGGVCSSVFGNFTSWWGLSRFLCDKIALPSEKQYDSTSSTLWTLTNCTVAYGADMVVTPSAGTCTLELDLGAWGKQYEMLPHLVDQIVLDWVSTNVTSLKAYVVGQDGTAKEITTLSAGTAFDLPLGSSTKMAGSWARDFSAASGESITGADTVAYGQSSASMADPERTTDLGYLTGRSAVTLRIVVVNTGNFTLRYPKLRFPEDQTPQWVMETGQNCAVIYADRRGFRWGSLTSWDYFFDTFANPPLIRTVDLGQATALDWLCFKRYAFRGVSATGTDPVNGLTLDGEIASIFTTDETAGARAEVARDPDGLQDTYSFLLTKDQYLLGCFGSSWREPPPLVLFPRKARDAYLQESGAYTLEAWSVATDVRRYVSPLPAVVDIYPSGSGSAWTSGDTAPSGWSVSKHQHAVDGTELATFDLKVAGVKLATVSPYHGYFMHPGAPSATASGCWHLHDDAGQLHLASIEDGKVKYWRSDTCMPVWSVAAVVIDSNTDCSRPRMWVTLEGRISVVYQRAGGKVYTSYSDDDGATWSTPSLLMSNAYTPDGHGPQDGSEIIVWFEYNSGTSGPGTLKGKYRDPGDSAWTSFTLKDGSGVNLACADGGFGNVFESRHDSGRLTLYFIVDGETAPSYWYSCDAGRTWTRTL